MILVKYLLDKYFRSRAISLVNLADAETAAQIFVIEPLFFLLYLILKNMGC